jgi:nucleotide sugar dehydrogenase
MSANPVDVVVIGLGYVGLPLAREATLSGLRVVGLDTSERVVAGLADGHSHVDDLSDADVQKMLDAGFEPTTDASVIADARTVVICVPTPLSEEGGPDLTAVLAAAGAVARHIRPGTLAVLESTTYPGTTDEVVRPLLESSGLVVGKDIHLAFSPERIDPGNEQYGFRNTPKVVGGSTPACLEAVTAFYSRIVDRVVPAKGTREAEMAKLLENTYRHVNIALVNEMVKFCHELDIDLWNVIDCAATKPFGFQSFSPGPGVGGHCIPIDPNYLSHRVHTKLGYPFRFVELAQEINAGMPEYVARRTQDLLNRHGKALNGARVLLLGVTYKKDISDQRESPAVHVARRLAARGATVVFHDPFVPVWHVGDQELTSQTDLDVALRIADVTVLLQPHSQYDLDRIAAAASLLLDTRGRLTPSEHVTTL